MLLRCVVDPGALRRFALLRYHPIMPIKAAGTDLDKDEVPPGIDAAVALFHSLSDATRLTIVRRLAVGEARVTDLVGELGLAQSTVSAHVACLRGCGLVEGRPEGRQVFYSLSRPELIDLLSAAEAVLAASGNAVALCPKYGGRSRIGKPAARGRMPRG